MYGNRALTFKYEVVTPPDKPTIADIKSALRILGSDEDDYLQMLLNSVWADLAYFTGYVAGEVSVEAKYCLNIADYRTMFYLPIYPLTTLNRVYTTDFDTDEETEYEVEDFKHLDESFLSAHTKITGDLLFLEYSAGGEVGDCLMNDIIRAVSYIYCNRGECGGNAHNYALFAKYKRGYELIF